MVRGRLSGPPAFPGSGPCVSTSFETIAVCDGSPRGEVAGWGRGRLRRLPLSLRACYMGAMRAPFIGLSRPAATEDERSFIRDVDPAGLILFGRNVESKAQLRALTDSLR